MLSSLLVGKADESVPTIVIETDINTHPKSFHVGEDGHQMVTCRVMPDEDIAIAVLRDKPDNGHPLAFL